MAAKKKIVRAGVRILCRHLQNVIRNRKQRKSRRCWVRPWILRRRQEGASVKLLAELAKDDLDAYKTHLRMSKVKFEEPLQCHPLYRKKNTLLREALPARLKLVVVLRYLATGDSESQHSRLRFVFHATERLFSTVKQCSKSLNQCRRSTKVEVRFSPLWFCLVINPLTNLLNSTGYGFNIRLNNTTLSKLNHLLYMDDLQLYAS
jgi:hypothetical protein